MFSHTMEAQGAVNHVRAVHNHLEAVSVHGSVCRCPSAPKVGDLMSIFINGLALCAARP
jgi:hypothetical protein